MPSTSQDAIPVSSGVATDLSVAENSSAAKTGGLTPTDRTELIQRMLREALDEPSSVAANLQVNGGDLLEMSIVLKKAIMEAAKSSSDVTELKELQSFVDTYVKVCRQADRVLRLKHEITSAPRGTSSVPARSIPYGSE